MGVEKLGRSVEPWGRNFHSIQVRHLANNYIFEALSRIWYLTCFFFLRVRVSCILFYMVLRIKSMYARQALYSAIHTTALHPHPLGHGTWHLWVTLVCSQAIWTNIAFIMYGRSQVKPLTNCIGHWSLVLVRQQWQKTQLAWRWAGKTSSVECAAPCREDWSLQINALVASPVVASCHL